MDTPKQGLGDVSSLLEDFVLATWDVDPAALAAQLPPGLEPDVYRLDDGRDRAFVSAASFVNRDFFVGFAPFVKLQAPQTNFRAYVRHPRSDEQAERAVFFLGTSLGSPVIIPRHVWGLPWSRSRGEHRADWSGERLDHLRWRLDSGLGEERLALRGTGAPMGRLDGFSDDAETHRVLTHPTVGYVQDRNRRVKTYAVWHPPFAAERASADEARFALYEDRGLVAPGQPPHSVLVQRRIRYLIFLPPRAVRWAP